LRVTTNRFDVRGIQVDRRPHGLCDAVLQFARVSFPWANREAAFYRGQIKSLVTEELNGSDTIRGDRREYGNG